MSWFALLAPLYVAVGITVAVYYCRTPSPELADEPRRVVALASLVFLLLTVALWPVDGARWLWNRWSGPQ